MGAIKLKLLIKIESIVVTQNKFLFQNCLKEVSNFLFTNLNAWYKNNDIDSWLWIISSC